MVGCEVHGTLVPYRRETTFILQHLKVVISHFTFGTRAKKLGEKLTLMVENVHFCKTQSVRCVNRYFLAKKRNILDFYQWKMFSTLRRVRKMVDFINSVEKLLFLWNQKHHCRIREIGHSVTYFIQPVGYYFRFHELSIFFVECMHWA